MTTSETNANLRTGLPDGYVVRPAGLDDVAAAVELMAACDLEDYGEAEETAETVSDYWRPMILDDDTRVVLDPFGQLVAYSDQAKRSPVRLPAYACVHPAHRGLGIGTFLTEWVESRAAGRIQDAPERAKVSLQFGTARDNAGAIQLLADNDYTFERGFQRMVIELTEPPPVPIWPDGVGLKLYEKGPDDVATWNSVEEAFEDHWGNVRSSFEDWSKIYQRDSFDASLWFLAIEGDEIAGACLCSEREELGWVGSLSVRRPWRRKGLALNLLHHSFAEFFKRGHRKVGLSVDSSSLTHATRVYERAGMHADKHTMVYAKVLRDGVETSTEVLA